MSAEWTTSGIVDDGRDTRLFVDLSAWIAPSLSNPTWQGFISWLQDWLAPESVELLRDALPFEHPIQIAAELALCAWLSRPVGSRWHMKRSETIERNVDWARTWAEAEGRIRYPYWNREEENVVPVALLRGLRGVARGWADMLERFHASAAHQRRAQELRQVSGEGPFATFDSAMARRLASLGGESRALAERLRDAYALWGLDLNRGQESVYLRASCERICQHFEAGARNIDDLLELSVHLSIARAGVQADPIDRLEETKPWRVASVERHVRPDKAVKPVITLAAGELRCEISKGHPERLVRGRWVPVVDRLNHAGATVGLKKRGNLPDVVLTFWRDGRDGSISVLGDAKRNASGSGKTYLATSVEVAAVYVVSYRDAMALELATEEGQAFRGPVMPALTLFARQLPEKEHLTQSALLDLYRGRDPGTRPGWIAAFDFERHLESGEPIAAWLGHLGRQARAWLREAHP